MYICIYTYIYIYIYIHIYIYTYMLHLMCTTDRALSFTYYKRLLIEISVRLMGE